MSACLYCGFSDGQHTSSCVNFSLEEHRKYVQRNKELLENNDHFSKAVLALFELINDRADKMSNAVLESSFSEFGFTIQDDELNEYIKDSMSYEDTSKLIKFTTFKAIFDIFGEQQLIDYESLERFIELFREEDL